MRSFDVVVIGSGTAGQSVAAPLAQAGLKVALADDRDWGGTCALRGCTAKKFWVANREAGDTVRALQGKGYDGSPRADWAQTLALKAAFTDPHPGRIRSWMDGLGVTALDAQASLEGPGLLRLGPSSYPRASTAARTAAAETVAFGALVIATGSEPRRPEIVGIDKAVDSEDFLSLANAPRRMVTLGGGYIAFEFAQIVASYGGQAVLIDRNERPLGAFDPGLVARLVAGAQHRGITFRGGRTVVSIEGGPGAFRVTDSAGESHEADLVLNAAGREPRTAGLAAERAGIRLERGGVLVDGWGRSVSAERVYAAGDVAAGLPMLEPLAEALAQGVVRTILNGHRPPEGPSPLEGRPFASTVFTEPPLAAVGLSEAEARAAHGDDLVVNEGDMASWVSSQRLGQTEAGFKVLLHRQTGRILGAHLLGHGSSEAVNLFALAMTAGLHAKELSGYPFAYPTAVSDLKYMLTLP